MTEKHAEIPHGVRHKPWIDHHRAMKVLHGANIGEMLQRLAEAGLVKHVEHKPRRDTYQLVVDLIHDPVWTDDE